MSSQQQRVVAQSINQSMFLFQATIEAHMKQKHTQKTHTHTTILEMNKISCHIDV